MWLTVQTISTVAIPVGRLRTDQLDLVDGWLRSVLWDSKLPEIDEPGKFEIHRSKGRLVLETGEVKIMQGVREVFEINDAPDGAQDASAEGKIILIGKHVADVDFEKSFRQAVQ